METQVAADIFKFTALRPPQNFAHEKDIVTIIRDDRIQVTHLPDETHTVAEDEGKFDASAAARYVFELVKEYLDEVGTPDQTVSLGDSVAENVKYEFGVNEKTGLPWIDDFVALIKQHLLDFDKDRLVAGLNEVVKRYFDEYAGVADYMELRNSDTATSAFCADFYALFERLYALYVAKRLYPINLEYVIDGLKALHVIRLLRFADPDKPFGNLFSQPNTGTHQTRTNCAFDGWIGGSALMQQGVQAVAGAAGRRLDVPRVPLKSKKDLASLFSATPYIHQLFACLLGYYTPFNPIRPIGIGDLLVVKQFLCKYEAGEIAHVENVLKGESKDRSHRRLDRTEDLFTTESETTENTERELQTSDRFELKNEIETTVQTDISAEAGTSVSGKYGTIEYAANAGVSFSMSTTESRRNTNNFAKDIVDRSVSRIQKRVREERSTKKIYEVEEINQHGLDNKEGKGHITGIYRWLDKHYKAQVFNYGKRLMFEFVIPEPSAFIAAAFEQAKKRQNEPERPQKPSFPGLDISQVTDATVNKYSTLYNIDDLEPSPAEETVKSMPIQSDQADNKEAFAREYQLEVPEGYEAKQVKIDGSIKFNDLKDDSLDTPNYFSIAVGDHLAPISGGDHPDTSLRPISVNFTPISAITGKVGISVLAVDALSFALTVTVKFGRKASTLRAWQIKTYRRIMDAYEKLVAQYQSDLAEYQDKLDGYKASQGIVIQGRNPRTNEQIIKTELKKHCLTMITKQFDTEETDDIEFNAMKSRKAQLPVETAVVTETTKVTESTPSPGTTVKVTETTRVNSTRASLAQIDVPAIDIADARDEGSIIQFLEQAFEWPQISYLLYPYFWGPMPGKWFDAQKYYDETDPLYAKFLQAGSVRVLVAVRPAYEIAVLHYLCTKKPWNGGPAPGINHPLYIPIHEELRDQQDDLNGAEPYGDDWEVVIPTSLVYLQKDSDLPEYDCEPPNRKKEPQPK